MTADHDSFESLSALTDGELSTSEIRFTLRRIQAQPDLAGTWTRYHLIGACMKRQDIQMLPSDFCARVQQALSGEARPRHGLPLLRWAGGLAVAASVTAVALIGFQPGSPLAPANQPNAAAPVASIAASPETAVAKVEQPGADAAVAEAPIRESDLRPDFGSLPAQTVAVTDSRDLGPVSFSDPRLESYLVRHNQALMAMGQGSPLSFVYVLTGASEMPAQQSRPAENR